jgi:hypothetical protein
MNFLKKNQGNQNVQLLNLSKTLKVLVLAVAFTFSGVLAASTNPDKKTGDETNSVTEKISKLLENPSVDLKYDASATVMLTVNMDNEIVVLSVDAENKDVASFIKARLNYQKLDGSFDAKLKAYKVPVKILRS